MKVKILLALVLLLAGPYLAFAQTTEFTYQGSLRDGSNAADGNYDFEFRLFSVDAGGTALGTLQRLGVAVSNGVFSVKLDFGAQFPGENRFLEIAVKPAGGGSFQQLSPRQSITSSPYNLRSLSAQNADTAENATNAANAMLAANSQQLGGVAASGYVLTGDARLTDARNPLPNSANYVQNGTTQQAASNFSIAGDGTAGGTLSGNVVNAALQFALGGNRI